MPGNPSTPQEELEIPVTPNPPLIPVTPPAIPEPGTWAMLLLGFAAVGASLRRTTARRIALAGERWATAAA
jgi:hypothetical protein